MKDMRFWNPFSAILLLLLVVPCLSWGSSGISYHGRILRPNGSPVSSTTTQFRIQIRTPGAENCLLWEEQQTKDLSNTNGMFSLTINDVSEPTLIANTLPYQIERVFSNRFNFTGLTNCGSGSTYNPSPVDGRRLQVYFRENPTDPWEQMPASQINFVPLALNSVQLEGYSASEFLKIDPASSYTTLTPTQVNTLMDIIAGTNTQYLRPSSTFSGDVTGAYNATVVEKIRGTNVVATAPTSGQVLKFDGTNWVPSADDTGGAPSDSSYTVKGVVQIDTNLATSGLNIASGVLSLPNLVTAGSVGSASAVPVITYDAKGRITATSTATVNDTTKLPLAGGTMSGSIDMGTQNITNATSIASTNVSTRNVVLNDNDTNTITLKAPIDVTPSDYTLTLPATAGTSGYVLSTDGSGNLSWVSASGAGALMASDYTADLADVDTCTGSEKPSWNTITDKWECVAITGFVTTASGFVQNGNSFAAPAVLGTNDAQPLHFETANSNKMTILTDGSVGVGTGSPSATLHVAHSVSADHHGLTPLMILGPMNNGILTNFRIWGDPGTQGIRMAVGANGENTNTRFHIYPSYIRVANGPLEIERIRSMNGGAPGTNLYLSGQGSNDGIVFETGGSSERMRITSTGDVGIGTTSPGAKLEVAGQVKITGGSPGAGKVLTSDASGLATWETPASSADNLGNHTATQNIVLGSNWLSGDGGNEGIQISSTGNVGVGTATPVAKLDVAGNLALNDNEFHIRAGSDSNWLIKFGSSAQYTDGAMKFQIPNGSSSTAGFLFTKPDNTPLMAIHQNGNVGIGTTNPGAKLEVAGTFDLNAGVNARIQGGTYLDLNSDNTIRLLGNTSAQKILAANGTGTFGGGYASTRPTVQIGDGGFTGGAGHFANGYGSGTWLGFNAASGFNGGLIDAQVNGVRKFSVDSDGDLYIAGQVQIAGGSPGAGKVLTSDASGLATWETPASGADNLGNHTATTNIQLGSNWLSGDGGNEGISVNASGNVGIGTTAPGTSPLRIVHNGTTGAVLKLDNLYNGQPGLEHISGGSLRARIENEGAYTTGRGIKFADYNGLTTNYSGINSQTADNVIVYPETFNAGVSLNLNTAHGSSRTGVTKLAFGSNNAGNKDQNFSEGASFRYDLDTNKLTAFLVPSVPDDGSIVMPASVALMTMDGDNARVGIGTTTPGAKLEVAGQIKITGGTPGAGKVLTSDATGLATWETPASGAPPAGSGSEVQFRSTASTFGANPNFVWDDTNARLGIGTATPSAKLTVNAPSGVGIEVRSNGGVQVNNFTNTDNVFLGWNDASTFRIQGAGSSQIILTGGNVGIGTTTPGAKLEVAGQVKITGGSPGAGKVLVSDATGLASWTDLGSITEYSNDLSNATCNSSQTAYWNAVSGRLECQNIDITSATAFVKNGGNTTGAAMTVGTNDNFNLNFETNGTNKMTIESAGDVGIGTTNPSSTLNVVYDSTSHMTLTSGGIKAQSTGVYGAVVTLESQDTGGRSYSIVSSGSGNYQGAGFFGIFDNTVNDPSSYRFMIAPNGNVGIGTGAATPSAKLEIGGQIKITGGSPAAGRVLTSDGSGLATWQDPAGGGGIQSPVALTATEDAACATIGQLAKDLDGDLLVCDDSPSVLESTDCSSVGVGAMTFDQGGNLYVCAN